MQRSSTKTITTIFFQSFCVLEARKTLSFKTLACKRQNNTLIFLFEILFYHISFFEILNWKIWKIGKYFREKLQQKKTAVVNLIEVLQA